ncbi:E3 ubiquitin-protein ligase RING1-like [Neltuma alba]|uniref:E3 ubiquitin-protein ligase RING1-like n=1 Tax=Neltuma alba TaxID=207710 RepID=UPI0010A4C943|nr:E3 ubiquitin-protein ligase RING1-like [Prosopis alba]
MVLKEPELSTISGAKLASVLSESPPLQTLISSSALLLPSITPRTRYHERPRLLMNNPPNLQPSPAAQLINGLAFILDPSMRERNTRFDRTIRWTEETEEDPNSQTWMTLRFVRPTRPQLHLPGATEENRPPPAADSAIEGLPTVKVTETQLATDPNCAICKDEFQIDME